MPSNPFVVRSGSAITPAVQGDALRLKGATSGQVDVKARTTGANWTTFLPTSQCPVAGYAVLCDTSGQLYFGSAGGSAAWESATGQFKAKAGSVTAGDYFYYNPSVANTGSNAAHVFENSVTLSSGRFIAKFNNNTTEKLSIDFDGNLNWPGVVERSIYVNSNLYVRVSFDPSGGGNSPYVELFSGYKYFQVTRYDVNLSTSLNIVAGQKIGFDGTSYVSKDQIITDSYLTKSLATGGSFSYFYDGTEVFRDDGTNCRYLASRSIGLYTAIGDAGSVSKLVSGGIAFGAGGTSAVDVQISRATVGIVALAAGNHLRLQGATSGYVQFSTSPVITSYVLKLPSAKGGAASTLWYDGTDTLSFQPTGWTALTSGATVAVDVTAFGPRAQLSLTLAGNVTIGNPTGGKDGQVIVFRIKQSAGGSNTVAFDTKYRFSTDISGFTMSSTANLIDYVTVIYNSTDDKWDVIAVTQGY